MGDAPQDDVIYNVVIGDTVAGTSDDHYHVLQYGFKPASIDRTQEGILKKTENGGIEVEFANTSSKATDNKVYFKGQYAPCKEYECILIFDSATSTFRLERLVGQGKSLKVVRKDQTKYTGKLEVPPDLVEPPEGTRPRGSTRPKPEPATAGHTANGTVTASGSSPDGDDGATPATKRQRTTRKPSSAPRRPRKTAAAKDKPEVASAEEPDDLLALVDQIESSVPSDTASIGEEEDFLAKAFEADDALPEPPAPPPRPSSNPIKPPPSLPSTTQPHQFPPIQQPNAGFGLPGRNGQPGYANGALPAANGALPNGAAPSADAGDSSSGSESESASESESESESASESSSESESENE